MPPVFLSKLHFEDNDGLPFVVLQDFIYYSSTLMRHITVPKGFSTDLASIPRFLWNILPPIGRYDKGAVLHDFLYRTGNCTRAEADSVLREAMRLTNVSWHDRWAIYTGIRSWGWVVWRRYRNAAVPLS